MMHFLNLVDIPPSFNNIKVELIPTGGCSDFGTRKTSKRREIEAMNNNDQSIDEEDCSRAQSKISKFVRRHCLYQILCLIHDRRHLADISSIHKMERRW